ncbi:MAG TPA: SAM-dependent methyltransferase, partial [Acidimicrobiales bacterium]|nr:SAM-dependent methyltransferase [Acidimicrobiales bacterium]
MARSHLSWMGVLDDGLAEAMLRRPWAVAGRLLRRGPLTRLGRNWSFAHVAARTCFFDDHVLRALDDGVSQVVVIGAGYDSRAWRLARPGVRFFEVDHPATQADKRARAPRGGPSYVATDLARHRLAEMLPAAGFVVGGTAVFMLEGLTMYLTESTLTELLATLAQLGGAGSRLVANFGVRGRRSRSLGWRSRSAALGSLAAFGR